MYLSSTIINGKKINTFKVKDLNTIPINLEEYFLLPIIDSKLFNHINYLNDEFRNRLINTRLNYNITNVDDTEFIVYPPGNINGLALTTNDDYYTIYLYRPLDYNYLILLNIETFPSKYLKHAKDYESNFD